MDLSSRNDLSPHTDHNLNLEENKMPKEVNLKRITFFDVSKQIDGVNTSEVELVADILEGMNGNKMHKILVEMKMNNVMVLDLKKLTIFTIILGTNL